MTRTAVVSREVVALMGQSVLQGGWFSRQPELSLVKFLSAWRQVKETKSPKEKNGENDSKARCARYVSAPVGSSSGSALPFRPPPAPLASVSGSPPVCHPSHMPHSAVLRWTKEAGLGGWHADFRLHRLDGRSLAAMHELISLDRPAFITFAASLAASARLRYTYADVC